MNIVGYIRKTGEFEGRHYDNVYFQCTEPFAVGKGFGLMVQTVKVKYSTLKENFGETLTGDDDELTAFVGQTADFYYDEYKNVKLVEIQKK